MKNPFFKFSDQETAYVYAMAFVTAHRCTDVYASLRLARRLGLLPERCYLDVCPFFEEHVENGEILELEELREYAYEFVEEVDA